MFDPDNDENDIGDEIEEQEARELGLMDEEEVLGENEDEDLGIW